MKKLSFFPFSKKKCPNCGNKMVKNKGYEIVDGSIFDKNYVTLYIQGRTEVKCYHYLLNCSSVVHNILKALVKNN